MPQQRSSTRHSIRAVDALVAVAFLMTLLVIPFLNVAVHIYISVSNTGDISELIGGLSIFGFYLLSLGLLVLIKKLLLSNRVLAPDQNVLSWGGFIRTFTFYALSVLFLSAYNAPSNGIELAIASAALLIYYQYIVEYVAKML